LQTAEIIKLSRKELTPERLKHAAECKNFVSKELKADS